MSRMPRTHWLPPTAMRAGEPGSPADQIRRAEFRGFLFGALWMALIPLIVVIVWAIDTAVAQ